MNKNTIYRFDSALIHFFRWISVPLARFGLFVVFFWFGFLKVVGESPAGPLVQALFERTFLSTVFGIHFGTFIVCFGVFEMIIGILFLIRGAERIVIPLLFLHMGTTFMPLVMVPQETWSGFFVPTLEGQYIIKNLALIAAAVAIAANLEPMIAHSKKVHHHESL
jgi:uncharacterized membrane protein YkgB